VDAPAAARAAGDEPGGDEPRHHLLAGAGRRNPACPHCAHLVDLLARQAERVTVLPETSDRVDGLEELDGAVTYLGVAPVEGLPEHAESITLERLGALPS
jgi:hypothetical protein